MPLCDAGRKRKRRFQGASASFRFQGASAVSGFRFDFAELKVQGAERQFQVWLRRAKGSSSKFQVWLCRAKGSGQNLTYMQFLGWFIP